MRSAGLTLLCVLAVAVDAFAQPAPATPSSPMHMLRGLDAIRGEAVFRGKGCFECHSYDGWGGMFGPDLGPNRIRGTRPSALAAAMWNQAPSMWRNSSTPIPSMTVDDSAALFAFFYSRLYFNDLGDSPHGEDLFKARCASCHDLRPGTGPAKRGPAVSIWGGLRDPIALVGRMWNHSSEMLDESLRAGRSWPRLSGQDTTDLLSYLWRLPEVRSGASGFRFGDDSKGQSIFATKCGDCHTIGRPQSGKTDLTSKLRNATIPTLAASMWSHAPAMRRSRPGSEMPSLSEDETRDLVTYLVVGRAFEETGDSTRGEGVFRSSGCNSCHESGLSGAPTLAAMRGPFDPVRMTSALWSHGPAMMSAMKEKRMRWPRFRDREMLDLLTFLNRRTGR